MKTWNLYESDQHKVSSQRGKFGSILVLSKVVLFRCRCLTLGLNECWEMIMSNPMYQSCYKVAISLITERDSYSVTEVGSKIGYTALETIFPVLTHILVGCFKRIRLFTTGLTHLQCF